MNRTKFINRYFNRSTITRDFFNFMAGEKLGSGVFRDVFVFAPNPKLVLKVETGEGSFANVEEFKMWEEVEYTSLAKWFAPCHSISPCGVYLLQERTKSISKGDKLPRRVPELFTDIKKPNWGWLNKRLVCHDYALNRSRTKGLNGRKFRYADWRDNAGYQ